MSKQFIAILLIIVLGFVGIITFNHKKAGAPSQSTSGQTTNHVTGTGSKGVTLLEYGDYQCPACGAYYPLVKTIVDKYKNDIFFQFRNFPLVQIHPNAFAGARAAEAADKQGKFWEMHDMLYEQQKTWSVASSPVAYFNQYASQLQLDAVKFAQDYASDDVNDLINADIKAGQAIGADSTPTFVIDGKKVDQNPSDQASFEKLINDAIAAKSKP